MKRILSFAILLLVASSAPNSVAAKYCEDGLSKAIEQYKAGDYNAAMASISCAQYDAGRAAEAHYYKACIMAKMGMHEKAIREFKLAKLLGQGSQYSALAAQALKSYGESTQTDQAQTQLLQALQQQQQQQQGRRGSDPPQIQKAAKRITSQAEERIRRVWNESNIKANNSPWASYRQRTNIPGFNSDRYRLIESQRRSSFFAGNRDYEYHRQRAKGVAESAEGLVSLLTRNDDGKGVYLVPEGTNLYVRNYEYGASIDPPLIPLRTDMKMMQISKVPLPVVPAVATDSKPALPSENAGGSAPTISSVPAAAVPVSTSAPAIAPAAAPDEVQSTEVQPVSSESGSKTSAETDAIGQFGTP